MKPTHATASNWRVFMTLPDQLRDADARLLRKLQILDGSEDWSMALWRLPDDIPTRGLDASGAAECLQSAGTRDRLSVELRRHEGDGEDAYAQYAVGRPLAEGEYPEPASVSWDETTITVQSNEVFTAEEAAPIYSHYLRHNSVPDGCTLRLIGTFPQ